MTDDDVAPNESEPMPHTWFYPAVVVLAAFACGLTYATITGKIISLADIADRINQLCVQAPETRARAIDYFLCVPVLNGGEIKARAIWAISLGITAITGAACLFYCLVSVVAHGRKKSAFPDAAFRGTFWAVTAFGVIMVGLNWRNANSGNLQSIWIDPIQPAISTLFSALRSPSRALTVESMVFHRIVPYESLLIAGALAIYVAVCAACLAPVFPLDPQKQKDPHHLFQLFERRKRVLNRVVAVASAALSLAIVSVGAYAAWPAALINGTGAASGTSPLATLARELTDFGNLSTLHWAASMITLGLPAYLIALVYLMAMEKRQAESAIAAQLEDFENRVKAANDRAEAAEKGFQQAEAGATTQAERDLVAVKRKAWDEERTKVNAELTTERSGPIAKIIFDREACATEWLKLRGVEMKWQDLLKRAVALLSPLLTGGTIAALSTALTGG